MENLVCNTNWLDDSLEQNQFIPNQERGTQDDSVFITFNTLGKTVIISNGYYVGGFWYPYHIAYFPETAHPVDLELSEVEYLRKQAKMDKKLKEILQKFTSNIRITVDFE